MLPTDEKPSTDLKTASDPYMLEAGLDPDQLSFSQNRKLVVESLITFHVIDKRCLALDDIIALHWMTLLSWVRIPLSHLNFSGS